MTGCFLVISFVYVNGMEGNVAVSGCRSQSFDLERVILGAATVLSWDAETASAFLGALVEVTA